MARRSRRHRSPPGTFGNRRSQRRHRGNVGLTTYADAPGSNGGRTDGEAVVLTLSLEGTYSKDVTLFMGSTPHDYRVLLGALGRGEHGWEYRRNKRYSAAGAKEFKASFA